MVVSTFMLVLKKPHVSHGGTNSIYIFPEPCFVFLAKCTKGFVLSVAETARTRHVGVWKESAQRFALDATRSCANLSGGSFKVMFLQNGPSGKFRVKWIGGYLRLF